MKISEPSEADEVQSASCRGGAVYAPRSCGRYPSPAAGECALGAFDNEIEQLVGLQGLPASQWSKDPYRLLNDTLSFGGGETAFVCPWNSGSRTKTESMQPEPVMTSSLVTGAARFSCPTRAAWSFSRAAVPCASRIRVCRHRVLGLCCSKS